VIVIDIGMGLAQRLPSRAAVKRRARRRRRARAQAYQGLLFRDALKAGWYDLLIARDAYRIACDERGLHRDLVARFLEARARGLPGAPGKGLGLQALGSAPFLRSGASALPLPELAARSPLVAHRREQVACLLGAGLSAACGPCLAAQLGPSPESAAPAAPGVHAAAGADLPAHVRARLAEAAAAARQRAHRRLARRAAARRRAARRGAVPGRAGAHGALPCLRSVSVLMVPEASVSLAPLPGSRACVAVPACKIACAPTHAGTHRITAAALRRGQQRGSVFACWRGIAYGSRKRRAPKCVGGASRSAPSTARRKRRRSGGKVTPRRPSPRQRCGPGTGAVFCSVRGVILSSSSAMQTSCVRFQPALVAHTAERAPACRRPLLSQGRGGPRERAHSLPGCAPAAPAEACNHTALGSQSYFSTPTLPYLNPRPAADAGCTAGHARRAVRRRAVRRLAGGRTALPGVAL